MAALTITEGKECGAAGVLALVQLETIPGNDFRAKVTLGRQNTSSNISILSYDIESTIEQFRYIADTLEKMYKNLTEGELSKWESLS
jgi:hypothetical protein